MEGDLRRKGLGQSVLILVALEMYELDIDIPLPRGIGLTEAYDWIKGKEVPRPADLSKTDSSFVFSFPAGKMFFG